MFFFLHTRPARAGFFSDLMGLLSGGAEASAITTRQSEQISAASFPLMGSQTAGGGTGGPVDDLLPPLQITQGNALVASRNPAGTLPRPNQDQIAVYTVEAGDTPGAIAEKFGISLNTLLWANNIRNADRIGIGDDLIILPVTGVHYTVKKRDTLESVAKEFKGDADDIAQFNGLAIGEPLEPGITLIIPDGEVVSPPAPHRPAPDRSSPSRIAVLPEYRGYFLRPVMGGRKSRRIHGYNAVDLANSCGLPVLASADGSVIAVRSAGWNGGYGKYLVVSHPNHTQTLYAHLSSVFFSPGQAVEQGNAIGLIGSTGNSTGCHVHFEIRGARNPF